MNIKQIFLLIILLSKVCAVDVFGQESEGVDVTHLDILLISTKNDLSDLVAIAESVKKYEDEEVAQFIKTLIIGKLFDLHFYLPKVKTPKTIDMVCDTSAVFLKGIRRVYGQCQSKEDELCLELDNLDKACSSSSYTK